MNALYAGVWLLAMWKWGDWRNVHKYYPTILFFLFGDLLYQYLLADNYPMWKYTPQGLDADMSITHTHISFSIMAIKYPATILIFLGEFPKNGLVKKALFFALWVTIYAINEIIDNHFGLITYHNGWSLGWSILFNIVMFLILFIHYKKAPLAWLLSILFILFLWQVFDVPSTVIR